MQANSFWAKFPKNHIQVQKEEENLAVACLRLPENVRLGIFRRSREVMAKKSTKKRDARAELLFAYSTYCFSTFSLSPLLCP